MKPKESETAFVKLSSSFFLPECMLLIFTHSHAVSPTMPCGNCESGAMLRAGLGVASGHTLLFFFTADTKELNCSTSVPLLRLRLSCQDLQTDYILNCGGGRGGRDPKQTHCEFMCVFIKCFEAMGIRRHASVDTTAVFSASAGGGTLLCTYGLKLDCKLRSFSSAGAKVWEISSVQLEQN